MSFWKPLALFVLFVCAAGLGVGCGGSDDRPAAPTFDRDAVLPEEPPPPPPPPEETIGHGIALEERTFVRVEPDVGARAIGLLRVGARFEPTVRREIDGKIWWKLRASGWVIDDEVRVMTQLVSVTTARLPGDAVLRSSEAAAATATGSRARRAPRGAAPSSLVAEAPVTTLIFRRVERSGD